MKQTELKKFNKTTLEDDGSVPENWEMVAEESKLTEASSEGKESAITSDSKARGVDEEDQFNTQVSTSLHTHNLMSISTVAAEVPLREDAEDNIVLGPGGQWGLQNDRQSLRMNQSRDSEGAVPRVPAWSLPTLRQQWEFSEITHHGRKKQKSLQRKKKKADD